MITFETAASTLEDYVRSKLKKNPAGQAIAKQFRMAAFLLRNMTNPPDDTKKLEKRIQEIHKGQTVFIGWGDNGVSASVFDKDWRSIASSVASRPEGVWASIVAMAVFDGTVDKDLEVSPSASGEEEGGDLEVISFLRNVEHETRMQMSRSIERDPDPDDVRFTLWHGLNRMTRNLLNKRDLIV